MKSIIEPFRAELFKYCLREGADFEKLIHMPRCGNDKLLVFQNPKKTNLKNGLNSQTPAEIILKIEKKGSEYLFEPGEQFQEYVM